MSSELRAEPDTQRSMTETAVRMAAPGVNETEAFDLNHDIAPINSDLSLQRGLQRGV
jgi:hypothetical protein